MKKTYYQQTKSKHLKAYKLIFIGLTIYFENRLKTDIINLMICHIKIE